MWKKPCGRPLFRSTVRKAGIFDTEDEGFQGSSALIPEVKSETQVSNSTPTVASNGRSKRSRKNRKRHEKRSDDVDSSVIRRIRLRIQSIFREVVYPLFFNVMLNPLV
jgi:hypothetical protein